MALRFEPPGPGSWELDPVHFPRPVTRYWTEIHPEALRSSRSASRATRGCWDPMKELRRFGDIHRNPSRLVFTEQLGRRMSPGFILKISK
jgi:hypothetical protein